MNNIWACINVLDQQDLDRLHQATLEVLAKVGCRMPNRRVLEAMRTAGASVDQSTATVYMPPALVEKAIQDTATRGIRQVERQPGQMVAVNQVFRVSPGSQANIVDYQARSRRHGTTEDVIKGIVLCNELPHIGSCMPLVSAGDIPAYMSDLYNFYLCSLYSRKRFGVFILSLESARQAMHLWEMVHTEKAQADITPASPYISYLLEPNGSLSFDEFSLEMALAFADAGHRIHQGPMAMAGLDAPVTLAGTLVIQNADNLAGIVLCHLLGLPGDWSGTAHTMDLRSALCSFGSPNQVLLGLAAIQLGNYYGFDVNVNSALTDACTPDFQGGFEKGMSAIVALLAGAKGVGAQGIVGADQGISFEQLVIDDEWAGAIDHIFQLGFEVNDETLAVDVIKKVGINGSYLMEEHTIRHMRETYWRASIFNHQSWDGWMEDGGKDVNLRAHEKVEAILAQHYPPQPLVSTQTLAAMDALITDARAHPERFEMEQYRYNGGSTI